jgi:tetratricopeptide (TPR) repeat protein
MNLLSATEIAGWLDHRFNLLTAGRRTALPRHQTLWAAIEWSYDLLNQKEQALFCRLSIFVDSFTLEATQAICLGEEIHPDETLTLLGHLVDKSLLQVDPSLRDARFTTRYRLLDSIHSFGRLKLDEAGETGRVQNRRADYYLRLVEAGEPELRGPNQLTWLSRLKEEHHNLRAVLQWSLDADEPETALRLVGSLWRYWWMHSHHNEGRVWLGKALSMAGPQSPPLRAKALLGAGVLARGQGDFDEASIYLNECLEIQRNLQDKNGITNALNNLGILAHLQGDYLQAITHYQESLKYSREIGDTRAIAAVLHNLSMIYQEKGELVQTEELLKESLALFLEINDVRNIAATQVRFGYLMYELGNVVQSEDYFRKSLLALKDLGGRNDIIECLEGFAGVAALLKQPRRGARLLAAARAVRDVIDIPVPRSHKALYQRIVENVANQIDSQAFELYSAEGRAMSLEEAIEYALGGAE